MAEQEVKRGRPARNPNDTDQAGNEKAPNSVPGRPVLTKDEAKRLNTRKDVKRKEVLFMTPRGVLCKKVYETFRTGRGSFQRLVEIQKNVKG